MGLLQHRRRGALGACLALVVIVAVGCTAQLPVVARPDLTARGYSETEYLLTGTARSYHQVGTWTSDGKWAAAADPTTKSFTTRLVVRRPIDAAKFNGTVLVEWLNVSSGFDIDVTYGAAIDELLRKGYAFVGVSAQKVGVDFLKRDNPERYGSLNHPGDDYSYDIFTQAGRAIRGAIGPQVLGGLVPKRLLATGESQSAFRMVTYINAVHPLVKVYQGFLVYSRGSGAATLSPATTLPPNPHFRGDQKAPIIDLQTEGDIVVLRSHLARQSDTSHFRLWEVAGGSHADEHTLSRKNPPSPTKAGSPCVLRANSASTFAVVSAAVSSLDRWVRNGTLPPHAPRITLGRDPAAADPVVRDRFGNAKGGIRLPELQVPTAAITGVANTAPPDASPLFESFCRLFGQTRPFSASQLASLYPTHHDYVDAFDDAVDAVVAKGFVLAPDGAVFKTTAAAAPIPS
jgi:alpha/beta hydrolase family protein